MRFFYPDQRQNTPWLRVSLLIVILASFGWRLHHLDFQSLWRDEVDAVWFALRDLPETLSMFIATGQNGALYFLSLRPWLSFIGSNEFALRFPSVWAATLALPVLWQVARRLVNGNQSGVVQSGVVQGNQTANTIALVTVLLLASNPYQLWYSQEGKMYAIITCLSLLATLFWLRGVDRGGWRNWLAYLIIVSLAIYFHLLMILLIPLHMLWFVIGWPQAKRQWKGYLLAIAGLTLPYLPMLWWQWDLLMAQDKRTGFNFTPLPEMLLTLALNHSFGFAPRLGIIWLAPLIFLAFAGLLLGWEKSSEETKLASAEEGSVAGKDPDQSLCVFTAIGFLAQLFADSELARVSDPGDLPAEFAPASLYRPLYYLDCARGSHSCGAGCKQCAHNLWSPRGAPNGSSVDSLCGRALAWQRLATEDNRPQV
jgi:4-amino-4-deoxy-L-arabinose transferase-like glycosyltransferase